jgi:lipopolysaccharide export system permease protein
MMQAKEITILQNAGLNKINIAQPVIILAILSSIICYSISLYFMPLANKEFRMKRVNFRNNYTNILINSGIFENLNDLTINVSKRSNDKLFGILIYDDRNPEYSMTVTASEGYIDDISNSILLKLKNGTIQRFNNKDRSTEILKFDSYVVDLNQNNKSNNNVSWKAKERFMHELINYEDDSSAKRINEYRVEIHKRMTMPLLSLILSMIAISNILAGGFNRNGNIRNILKAILYAIIFMATIVASYNMAEKDSIFTPLIYFNFLTFFLYSTYIIAKNKLHTNSN